MAGKAFLLAAVVVPALCAAAGAQSKYDVKLERAVMERVAGRIGDIRPGFGFGQQPAFVMRQERPTALSGRGWQVISSDHPADRQQAGSMVSFSEDLRPTAEEPREASSKTVSRIIQF